MPHRSLPILSRSAVITAASHQVSCEVGDETVILQLERGIYFGLNPVGASVWKLLRRPRTLDEVLCSLLAEYDVAPARCEQDLLQLLEKMAAAGLVQIADAPPP